MQPLVEVTTYSQSDAVLPTQCIIHTHQVAHGLGDVGVVWTQLRLVDLQSSLVVVFHLQQYIEHNTMD